LPFSLDAGVLRHLAALPSLSELFTWADICLAGAAPPVVPGGGALPGILDAPSACLRAVTKLVASAVRAGGEAEGGALLGPRHELDCVFPSLRALYVKRGGDAELRLAAGCGPRLEALVLYGAGRVSDDGVALLRACRGLARLQIEDAPRLGDGGLAALFQGPVPALQHLALHRLPGLGDTAMQAATAACRRLVSASLAHCPGLTDKTLSRMARMEHLAHVQLVRLGPGVTADGVRALVAAPGMQAVHVAGCAGVRAGGCRQHRPGVRVKVDEAEV
jgi:hypothetical protein